MAWNVTMPEGHPRVLVLQKLTCTLMVSLEENAIKKHWNTDHE